MKKIAILAIAVVTTTISFAQTTRFGIKAGIQNNLLAFKSDDGGERAAYTGVGFHVGGIADLKFSENFSVQPQLLFTSKGLKLSDNSNISLLNIDLPVNLLYRHSGFFIGAGPNFSYGLSGKAKADGEDQDLYKKEGGEDASLKRFDIGTNVTLGYELPAGLLFSANYTQGLGNLSNEETGAQYRHRLFGFTIGYFFNAEAGTKK